MNVRADRLLHHVAPPQLRAAADEADPGAAQHLVGSGFRDRHRFQEDVADTCSLRCPPHHLRHCIRSSPLHGTGWNRYLATGATPGRWRTTKPTIQRARSRSLAACSAVVISEKYLPVAGLTCSDCSAAPGTNSGLGLATNRDRCTRCAERQIGVVACHLGVGGVFPGTADATYPNVGLLIGRQTVDAQGCIERERGDACSVKVRPRLDARVLFGGRPVLDRIDREPQLHRIDQLDCKMVEHDSPLPNLVAVRTPQQQPHVW